MSIMAYIGGAPYPVFETFIALTLIFFATSVYIGLRYEATNTKVHEHDADEEVIET